jgi:hypothetical protein
MKHKLRLSFLLVVLTLVSLVASSCALRHEARPPVYIEEPHNGNTFPSNASVTLRVSTYGISQNSPIWETYDYEVLDNGVIISEGANRPISETTPTMVLGSLPDGTHLVVVRGRASHADRDYADAPNPNSYRIYSDWYSSNQVCFFTGPNPPDDFCTYVTIAQGVRAVTPTPSPFPTFAPTAIPVIQGVSAFPSPIYYGDTCPSLSSVTFRAVLGLPAGTTPDQVDVQAHASVGIGSVQSNSGSFLVPLQNTGTWDTATGGAVYSGTLALTHAYNDANNQFDPAALAGGSGALLWYADASSHAGSLALYLGRSANQVISLAPCPTGGQPRHQDNPGGSDSGSGCGQYTNQLSCNLAGCSWLGTSCVVTP